MVQEQELKEFLLANYKIDEDGKFIRAIPSYNGRGKTIECGILASKGYLIHKLFGRTYTVHRLIFLMHYGYLPKVIDHINEDKVDNRPENLRPASKGLNGLNISLPNVDNKIGLRGVMKMPRKGRNRYRASCCGKFLGYYDTPEKASEVYEGYRRTKLREYEITDRRGAEKTL